MEIAPGGLSATLRDYARFGLFMLQDGAWNGQQLLPAGWVQKATHPDGSQVKIGGLYKKKPYPLGYGYFWWCMPGADQAFSAVGLRGQFLYVNPAEHLVIVVTNAWRGPEGWDDGLERQTYALFDGIAAALH